MPLNLSRPLPEISEKVQKSLITPLPAGRQGLKTDYTDARCIGKPGKSVQSFFKICVIRRARQSFSELSNGLRLRILFVKIRGILVIWDEGREIHFYSIDHRDFLAGPRNSYHDKRRGSEGNNTPRATSSEVEKRTGRFF